MMFADYKGMKEAEIMTKKYEGDEEPPADYTPDKVCRSTRVEGRDIYHCGRSDSDWWGEDWFESESRFVVKSGQTLFRFRNKHGDVRDILPCAECYADGKHLPNAKQIREQRKLIVKVEPTRETRGLFLQDLIE